MKRFLPLLLLALPFGGCSDSDSAKKSDPTPATKTHTVEVRYQGANLTNLEPQVYASSVLPDGTQAQNVLDERPTATSPALTVRPLGTVAESREFNLSLTFLGIKPGKTIPAGAYLSAELYVDGAKVRTLRLDNTNTAASFPTASTTIMRPDWSKL